MKCLQEGHGLFQAYFTIIFTCILMSGSAHATEKFSHFGIHSPHPSSYFDVLGDHSASLGYLGDEHNINSLKNLSQSVFHAFRHLNNLVFSGESDKTLHEFVKLIQESDIDQLYREQLKALVHDGGINNIHPESLKFFRDNFKTMDKNQQQATPSTCINDTGRIITELLEKKDWAIQFFDAMGKPGPSVTQLRVNFIGNYDQCRAAIADPSGDGGKERKDGGRFKGNYVTIVIKLIGIPLEIKLGACMPDTCSSYEINVLIYQLFMTQKKKPQYAYCYIQNGETEMTSATKFSISILSIIGFFMIIGTLYDVLVIQRPKWTKPKTKLVTNMNSVDITSNGHYESHTVSQTDLNIDKIPAVANGEKTPLLSTSNGAGGGVRGTQKPLSPAVPNGVLAQVFLSFSVYSNGKKMLNTAQAPGSLTSIHGIRFLSMSWVVLCHMFAFASSYALDFFTAYQEFFARWTFSPISNGFVSVDTFFTLSGLLTSYLTIKEIMRKNTWKINWPMFYFHRFWRLTPPYMLAMVIVLGLTQYFGQGAMWAPEQPYDRKNCEKYWWTNLLYVNNLVHFDKSCFGHAWYLANDMQFFVLSPLMLIPFYFHRAAGFLSCGAFLLASWISTGVLSHHRKWPATTESLKPHPDRAGSAEWMEHYYIVPWCRIGPFIVGIMAGYILAQTKGKPFKMPKWVVSLGWIVSIATGLAVVYGLYGDIKGDHPSSLETAAFYNAVHRTAWGVCVSWVIIACSAGYGGPVNTLLSWSPFVFLGRLTYMSYLIHICIVYTFYQNLDNLFTFNDTTIVVYYLGILVFVNLCAFVSVLVLESPMLGLEKTFIRKERKD